jgi:transmembrane sensor
LGKKKSGDITPEELEELTILLAGADGGTFADEVLDKVWEFPLNAMPPVLMSKAAWNNIQKKINTGERATTSWRVFTGARWLAAASLLLVVASATILYIKYGKKHGQTGLSTAMMNHVATQAGSRTRLELPDGTQVWLNANSQLAYGNKSFGTEEREVTLSGEAFFDVAKNERVPFIIHTGNITITVMGTAFNVRAYPREKTVETALIRGLVEITTAKDPDRKIILKPNEKIIVPADNSPEEDNRQTVAANSPSSLYSIVKLRKDSTQAIPETVWMESKLEFDNEPFEELAPKLENWFNIKIHFRNEGIKKRRFSAIIEKETLTETLDAMRISGHFSYQIKDNELWIGEN